MVVAITAIVAIAVVAATAVGNPQGTRVQSGESDAKGLMQAAALPNRVLVLSSIGDSVDTLRLSTT